MNEPVQPPVIPPAPEPSKLDSQGDVLQRLNFWKLAIAKLFVLCVLASVASIQASLNGIVAISEMTGTQLFLASVAWVGAVGAVVLAFLSDTMQKLSTKAEKEKSQT